MHQNYLRWLGPALAGLLGLAVAPAMADDDWDDWDDDDDVTVRYRFHNLNPSEYRTYSYSQRWPQYRTHGYVDGHDYTEPENAWWRDYEAMNAQRRTDAWRDQGQVYGYTDDYTNREYYVEEPFARRERDTMPYSQTAMVRLSGTIVELRQFQTGRWSDPQAVAIVDTGQQGIQRVVLGSVRDVTNMDVRPGDRISVNGRYQTIAGRTNLVAETFDTGYTSWTQREAAQPGRWYHGEVRDDDIETIGGVERRLVRVKLDNGDRIQVDLGPEDALPAIDLDRGDDIAVFGRFGSLEGETTLFADRFRWDGRAFVLNRGAGDLDLEIHAYR